MRHRLVAIGLGLLVLGSAIQLVPYGRPQSDPSVEHEPEWSDDTTRELFFRACGDCHSHQTRWPWYARVAPASWLVRHDVDEGRAHFDVSASRGTDKHGDDAAEMVRSGEMPLWYYLPAHPEARLSEAERQWLIEGLVATFGDAGPEHDHAEHDPETER